MASRWQEREQAIVNGLLSLIVNECDVLDCLKRQGGQALYEGLAEKVRPTLQVCGEEFAAVMSERARLSQQAEAQRQALEYVASNARATAQAHIEAFALRALGRN